MRILISGASGFLGRSLCTHLEKEGHEVYRLVRKTPSHPKEIFWSPSHLELDPNQISKFSCIINLSGENIAKGLWTANQKRKILESRINSTKTLVKAIKASDVKPQVFLNASAIGIYAPSDDPINENSAVDKSFLASVCTAWESESSILTDQNVRIAFLRFGLILDPSGGSLSKMIIPFKLGLGATFGQGTQHMSWISLRDTLEAVSYIIKNESLLGPINICSPNPVTNREFSQTLAGALKKPCFLNLPKFILSGLLGEMAEEIFLKDLPVHPLKLSGHNFTFKDKKIDEYFKNQMEDKADLNG